jgi:hypothetical protein
MLVVQEPARRQEYLKTDYAHVFHVPNRGRPLAMLGDLKVREAVQWMQGMAHIWVNGIVEKSTGQCSPKHPWVAL